MTSSDTDLCVTMPREGRHGSPTPRRGALVKAEVRRTFSTRGWLILLGVAGLMTGLGAFTAAWAEKAQDAATESGLLHVFASGYLSALLATLVGVTAVTKEFSHGTAGSSIVLSRGRRPWWVSKLVVAVPLGLACTLLGQGVSLAVGVSTLAGRHVTHPSVWQGDMLRSTLGTVSLGALCAVWGVGLGLIVRNQLAAVAGVIIYAVVLEGFPLHFWTTVGRFLPGGAQAGIAVDPTIAHLSMGWAYLVLVGWVTAALALGAARTRRSDIPSPLN